MDMKNNSKNRKLKFIREKNKLRVGKYQYYLHFKVSRVPNINIGMIILDKMYGLYKKYNLDYSYLEKRKISTDIGYMNDDFVNNLVTVRIIIGI